MESIIHDDENNNFLSDSLDFSEGINIILKKTEINSTKIITNVYQIAFVKSRHKIFVRNNYRKISLTYNVMPVNFIAAYIVRKKIVKKIKDFFINVKTTMKMMYKNVHNLTINYIYLFAKNYKNIAKVSNKCVYKMNVYFIWNYHAYVTFYRSNIETFCPKRVDVFNNKDACIFDVQNINIIINYMIFALDLSWKNFRIENSSYFDSFLRENLSSDQQDGELYRHYVVLCIDDAIDECIINGCSDSSILEKDLFKKYHENDAKQSTKFFLRDNVPGTKISDVEIESKSMHNKVMNIKNNSLQI